MLRGLRFLSTMRLIGVEVEELMNNCYGLISSLDSHVEGLTKFLTELSIKDYPSAVSLRSSLVKSSTALAEILDLMSRISTEPTATDYRRRCIAALMRAVEVVRGLRHEDFTIIGVLLGVRNQSNDYPLITLNRPRLFRSRSSGCRPY